MEWFLGYLIAFQILQNNPNRTFPPSQEVLGTALQILGYSRAPPNCGSPRVSLSCGIEKASKAGGRSWPQSA